MADEKQINNLIGSLDQASETPGRDVTQEVARIARDQEMLKTIRDTLRNINPERKAPYNYTTYNVYNDEKNHPYHKKFKKSLLDKGYNLDIAQTRYYAIYTIKWGVDFTKEESDQYYYNQNRQCEAEMLKYLIGVTIVIVMIMAFIKN
jgi:hypothetical protein